MKPIYGVWHVSTDGPNSFDVIREQLTALYNSKILIHTSHFFINFVGCEDLYYKSLNSLLSDFSNITCFSSPNSHDFEYPSLKIAYDLANLGSVHSPIENQPYSLVKHPFNLFYMHTKGSFVNEKSRYENAVLWRKYMEYFILDSWEDCVKALEDHDICGVEWREEPSCHFSGNFWWARDSYLQKLPNIIDYWSKNRLDRIQAEMYIGQSYPNYKDFSNFGLDMYFNSITEDKYRSK